MELKPTDMVKAAVLVSEQTETWVLIFGCREERDGFVRAMQILQLYQTLAECGLSTPKKGGPSAMASTVADHQNDQALLRWRPQFACDRAGLCIYLHVYTYVCIYIYIYTYMVTLSPPPPPPPPHHPMMR